jgi:hypothetical protein
MRTQTMNALRAMLRPGEGHHKAAITKAGPLMVRSLRRFIEEAEP